MNKKKILAEVVLNARKDKNISQRSLEKETGIDRADISRIENGKRLKPSSLILRSLAISLNLDYINLLELAGYSDIQIKNATAEYEPPNIQIKEVAKTETRQKLKQGTITIDELMEKIKDGTINKEEFQLILSREKGVIIKKESLEDN